MIRGKLFVISAPSGTGKTTLLHKLMAQVDGIAFSVSHTTRAPRRGEQEGLDYHFVDRATFEKMRARDAFLESAEVHGNFYGTSREAVDRSLEQGWDILLDIDVQGARQIREVIGPEGVSIFIVPPSWEELERRLRGRGTDTRETVELRYGNARFEMADINSFDYVVVNDRIDEAVGTLRSIIISERSKSRRTPGGGKIDLELTCSRTCKE